MNSAELDVERIYELARLVHQKLGQTAQADSETWWRVYEDEQIRIPNSGGHPPDSFRVYQKRGSSGDLVLEWHAVNKVIDTKEALLRDMLHHSDWCDEYC